MREKHEVQAEAKAKGETVHFGGTMELGFIKHSQLEKKYWVYKGRIVFRGDNIRDENGVLAVFSEQAASASHVEAARSLDALARMPDCDGFDIDAIGAFHQIPLGKDCPTTWCSVPKHRQPPEWAKYKNPVCIMGVNLYGHPQAQNYWHNHVNKIMLGEGFVPVTSWECVYVHHEKKLLVSVYVDDFKLVGIKTSLGPMI